MTFAFLMLAVRLTCRHRWTYVGPDLGPRYVARRTLRAPLPALREVRREVEPLKFLPWFVLGLGLWCCAAVFPALEWERLGLVDLCVFVGGPFWSVALMAVGLKGERDE